MVASAHVYERLIRAPRREVWAALTDPDRTEQYFFGTRLESSMRPGEKYRYVDADDLDVIDGELETVDEPTRLVMTFRMLRSDDLAAEPPSRVEWTLADADPTGSVTRLTLRHGELALSPGTWEEVRHGWVTILDSLKSYLETGTALPAVSTEPAAEPATIEANWHRAQAVIANNSVWELLDGRTYTPDDADELLQRAYAAAYHWHRAAGATMINQARAAWLVSRAHATLGHGELALHHAAQCAAFLTRAGDDAADFDHAYVYEARARALACLGRHDEAREAYRRARRVPIADEQDRAIIDSDLSAGPWFGLEFDTASE
ncbi:MAG: SRPBCC domain-containing protein [Ilumatobacter sp.]|nr:SRPBCC domain-containing protein [Ilumatobacter sp.]